MNDFDFSKVIDKKDEGVFARFYDKWEKTNEINEFGLPIFKVRTWVEIKVRDSQDIVDTRADNEHIARFPREYNFYLTKKEKEKEGTPLNMFAFLNPAQIECCQIRGIFTVEALSGLDKDKALSLGLVEEVELAKKFITMAGNNQEIKKYQDKIKELEDKILYLEEENKALRESK